MADGPLARDSGTSAVIDRPVPFRQFVVKVHSRCNLACDYCYVYEMADQGWRDQPLRMSERTVTATVARIAEHVREHTLPAVSVVLHGGEPLLAGPDFLAGFADRVRRATPCRVEVGVQTNGVLLDETALKVLTRRRIRIGVSLDGGAAASDRHRRFPDGRSSHAGVERALTLLRQERFRDSYGGILCTVDLAGDPVECYESLVRFAPPMIDLLLPHGTWSVPPPGRDPRSAATPYADWLLAVFERWYAAPVPETSVRLFTEIIQLLLGGPGSVEGLGLRPSTVVVVDTDGSIKQLDSLSAVSEGASGTGLNVTTDPFDAALTHPLTIARQGGLASLGPTCRACPIVRVCGGGLFPHRYRAGHGFTNPSVYCPDLQRLITGIHRRISGDLLPPG
jgi:uncharacterized protein